MKKHFYFIIIFSLICLLSANHVFAAFLEKVQTDSNAVNTEKTTEVKEQVTTAINNNIDQVKQILIQAIDKIIAGLNQSQTVINNYSPSPASEQAIALLDQTVTYLEGQQTKIDNATSLEDLRSIQQETIQYLKDHQDELKSAVIVACDEAYRQTVEMMRAYLELASIQSKAMLLAGEIDKTTFDSINDKNDQASNLIDQSESLYTQATSSQNADQLQQSLQYLAQAGVLIYEIEEILVV